VSKQTKRISIVVVLPDEPGDEYTLFQGFSIALNEVYSSMPLLVRAPMSATEYPYDMQTVFSRALGLGGTPFFLISNLSTFRAFAGALAEAEDQLIFAACHPSTLHSATTIANGSRGSIETFRLPFDDDDEKQDLVRLRQMILNSCKESDEIKDVAKKLSPPLRTKGHNLVTPNLDVLLSAGIELEHTGRLISTSESAYISEICRSVELVEQWRSALGEPPGVYQKTGIRLIVAMPGVVRHLASKKKWDTRKFGKNAAMVRKAIEALTRQRTYMHEGAAAEPIVAGVGNDLYLLRGKELRLFTAGLSLLTTFYICPLVRLPPRASIVWAELRDAESYDARADAKATGRARAETASNHARRIGNKIHQAIPADFLTVIENTNGHIKFVSDAPAELIPRRGMPISMTKTVSRICATPGNAFMQQCFPRPKIYAEPDFFTSVLIIRSFAEDDPLRQMMEHAVGAIADTIVQVRIVDVASANELAATINVANEKIVIFDGHGEVDDSQVGYLLIGGERVNTWDLRKDIMKPPVIFLLSACMTHSLDTSHASVANGILSWGCLSVVGTLGVIKGDRAALTIARFISWLEHTLLARMNAHGTEFLVSWADGFSRFLRQVYALDVVLALKEYSHINLTETSVIDLLFMAVQHIYESPEWIESFAQDIAMLGSTTYQDVISELEAIANFPDAV
jgi:hypothetical protein